MVIGGKQATRLHGRGMKPGMSLAEVLGRVDEANLWSLGLSHVFAFGEGCPSSVSLAWSSTQGSPWRKGTNQTLDDAAGRLATCERIDFRLVVPVSRFHFVLSLKDGRVSAVSPVEGQFE